MHLSLETKALARGIFAALGTPLSLKLRQQLELGEWATIASCKVSPRDYTSAEAYFRDAVAGELLRKCEDLPTPDSDRRLAALANWKAGEDDCFRTNRRLFPYLEGATHPSVDLDVLQHIAAIREKIASVLGRCPKLDDLQPRHGPGATFSDPSDLATVADKMDVRPSITRSACWFLLDWMGTAWGHYALKRDVRPVQVRGNRFSVAPKDATKHRCIAAEPSVNIFYQLALGGRVRSALKRVGIDLDGGQATHVSLAYHASVMGDLVTLDLKNASDTLAYSLVKLLLPTDWFQLFCELRSPFTRMKSEEASRVSGRALDGKKPRWFKLEKFSSMGNGFTFELETLIFWAIASHASKVACDELGLPQDRVWVYGDDIICTSRVSDSVIAALRFFGFTLNDQKSFVSGPFRESCGGDFWHGRPVRPFNLKASLDEPHQLIAAANQVRSVAHDLFKGSLGAFAGTWCALQDHLPSHIRRCRGPSGLGDIVLHDDERWWSWTSNAKDRLFAYVPVSHRKVSLKYFSRETVFACMLYGIDINEGFINPRDSVSGYGIRKVFAKKCEWTPSPFIRRGEPSDPVHAHSVSGPTWSKAYRLPRNSAVLGPH